MLPFMEHHSNKKDSGECDQSHGRCTNIGGLSAHVYFVSGGTVLDGVQQTMRLVLIISPPLHPTPPRSSPLLSASEEAQGGVQVATQSLCECSGPGRFCRLDMVTMQSAVSAPAPDSDLYGVPNSPIQSAADMLIHRKEIKLDTLIDLQMHNWMMQGHALFSERCGPMLHGQLKVWRSDYQCIHS